MYKSGDYNPLILVGGVVNVGQLRELLESFNNDTEIRLRAWRVNG